VTRSVDPRVAADELVLCVVATHRTIPYHLTIDDCLTSTDLKRPCQLITTQIDDVSCPASLAAAGRLSTSPSCQEITVWTALPQVSPRTSRSYLRRPARPTRRGTVHALLSWILSNLAS
jgi:hypothetical protein